MGHGPGEVLLERSRRWCPRETVKAADDLRFPIQVSPRNGLAKRKSLDLDAGLREIEQVIHRYRRDTEAALICGFDQPVGDQPRQRLAYRSGADLIPLA